MPINLQEITYLFARRWSLTKGLYCHVTSLSIKKECLVNIITGALQPLPRKHQPKTHIFVYISKKVKQSHPIYTARSSQKKTESELKHQGPCTHRDHVYVFLHPPLSCDNLWTAESFPMVWNSNLSHLAGWIFIPRAAHWQHATQHSLYIISVQEAKVTGNKNGQVF